MGGRGCWGGKSVDRRVYLHNNGMMHLFRHFSKIHCNVIKYLVLGWMQLG
jgi:hypothetical protein